MAITREATAQPSPDADHDVITSAEGTDVDEYDSNLRATSPDYVAYSPCGTIGVSYVDLESFRDRVRLYALDGTFTEIEAPSLNYRKAFFFSSGCTPAFFASGFSGLEFHRYDGTEWRKSSVPAGSGISWLIGLRAVTDGDGNTHVLIKHGSDELSLTYLTDASGRWESSLIGTAGLRNYSAEEEGDALFSLAIDSQGRPHVAFSQTDCYQGNPDLGPQCLQTSLWYATLDGGTWVRELVDSAEDESSERLGASIAILPGDRPAIAATRIERADTLSARFADLLYFVRQGSGDWSRQFVIGKGQDSFCGNDGCEFTGGSPDLFVDDAGRPHIFFTDIASSHYPCCGQLFSPGNLRLASNDGSGWKFTTLFRSNDAPRDDDDPEVNIKHISPIVSADGSEFAVAFLDTFVDIEDDFFTRLNHRYMRGSTRFAGEGFVATQEPMDPLLGRLLGLQDGSLGTHDRNGDAVVDIADHLTPGFR
ncbi:MAG: hypothetical protein RLY93_09465 [Sumerlaeia bacterium]